MRGWVLFASAVVGISLLGTPTLQGVDVGMLEPVEVVWLADDNGEIFLQTDTGNTGRGATVSEALKDLQASAAGYIFLETADYLIIERNSVNLLEQIYDVLRPSCMVCTAEMMPDLEHAAAFLEIHSSPVTLRKNRMKQENLPQLREQEGRLAWFAE